MKLATTILMFCVAALIALGMVMLYSASMTQKGGQDLIRQLAWCGLGLGACVTAACVDYHKLKRISPFLLAASAVLLLLVFVPHLGLKITARTGG